MPAPRLADLRSLASELSNDARYRRLATTLRKAETAQSCSADLRIAQATCNLLIGSIAKLADTQPQSDWLVESSLTMQAVLLYARATHTAGQRGERGGIDIRPHLTPSQISDHKAIIAVRNRAIAHVYSRESIEDEIWNDSRPYLLERSDGTWTPGNLSKVRKHDVIMVMRLAKQIRVADSIVSTIFKRYNDVIIELLTIHKISSDILQRHLVDPSDWFGSPEGAERVLSNARKL